MADETANTLVTSKSSEAPLTIALHPLVLLTASDLITRHHVRRMEGPIVGILLGQQRGQEITAEHAFPGRLEKNGDGRLLLHKSWTETRIQQFRDVHKAPVLDVVGWFTTTSEAGPTQEHLDIQRQVTSQFCESGIFLAIHLTAFNSVETTNRKLPLTTYESILELDTNQDETNMQVDGEETSRLKFREIPYSIETDETEMIAIDYVAKGAGSAAAIEPKAQPVISKPALADTKGKQRADGKTEKTSEEPEELVTLTTEEEDQVAGITTRLNSIKMLQSRLHIISRFISSLPPSYLSDDATPLTSASLAPEHLPHIRRVQALLTRLSLLTPPPLEQGQELTVSQEAALSQKNDVALTTLLAQLGQDVQGLDELGRKFAAVEQGKNTKAKNKGGLNQGTYGGSDEHDGRVAGFNLNSGILL